MQASLWLLFNLLTIISLAFFSMMEMALVSFNPVRLQYYLSKNNPKALKVHAFLKNPMRLFGTTLIGVNVSMVVGSECARQFHAAIGLSPDLAPLTQVIVVVIFGELAPMFSARQYAEQVALLFINPFYMASQVLTPFIWIISGVTKLSLWFIGGAGESPESLSREELLRLIAEKPFGETSDLDDIAANLFQLRHVRAIDVMTPLHVIPKLASNATCKRARDLIREKQVRVLPIFKKRQQNIVGIALIRDLINTNEESKIGSHCLAPWFVTESSLILKILEQFRKNQQTVAIVLNSVGDATGIIQLSDLLKKIFLFKKENVDDEFCAYFLEKTYPGSLTVREFNTFIPEHLHLSHINLDASLSKLMRTTFGRMPEEGESIDIGAFKFTVKSKTLMDLKEIEVKTIKGHS